MSFKLWMSSLLATFAFAQAQAGSIETGIYHARDLEGGEIQAEIKLNEDKTVLFRLATPDFVMPAPGCTGTYEVQGHDLAATLSCPNEGIDSLNVILDITNVTPESVRSEEGARVDVIIDLLGSEPMPFKVKKVEAPVFP